MSKETRIVSPYAKLYNKLSWLTPIRASITNSSESHHHTIVLATPSHGALLLGAVPNQNTLEKISQENKGRIVTRVSILPYDEEEDAVEYSGAQGPLIRIAVFDHSAMSPTTGLNITIDEVRSSMDEIAEQLKDPNSVVYFHCLAGHSRSGSMTIAFLYSHPEFLEGADGEFGNPPSLREIADFVKSMRPEVTAIDRLKSGQKGLLGLMTLSCQTENLRKEGDALALDSSKAQRIAQDVAFMLNAPLDRGFRDENDRLQQEENFAELYKIYKKARHNLLLDILPTGPDTLARLEQLSSNEQARFAILAQSLIASYLVSKEELETELGYSLGAIVEKALEEPDKLTAGDLVELFRTFGTSTGLTFAAIAEKITRGETIDKHNAGIQLAELLQIAHSNHSLPPDNAVDGFIKKLSAEERGIFDEILSQSIDPELYKQFGHRVAAAQHWQVTKNPLYETVTQNPLAKKTGTEEDSPPRLTL